MRRARGTTMIITLVILTVLSLLGVSLATTVQTDLAVSTARQWLSETRENAEQGLRVFLEVAAEDALEPGMVDQTFVYDTAPELAGAPNILNGDQIQLRAMELFCGDDGSTGTGSMLGTGAKRVWYNIESSATGGGSGTRAQINFGASQMAPANACDY